MQIGSLTLSPEFDGEVENYTTETTDATNTITATPVNSKASVSIKVNGSAHENDTDATWVAGDNTVSITITYGTTTKTYSVVVTYNAA